MKKAICIALIVFVLLAGSANAISIGISPGRVQYANLLPGGYAQREITLSTNSEDAISGHFTVAGDIKEWVEFDPDTNEFEISRGNPHRIRVIVRPPSDLRNGNYAGSIEFITDSIGGIGGRAGNIVKAAVILLVDAQVGGDEVIKCRAGGVFIRDAEIGFPLEFGASVINDGNVRLNPTLSLTIWDQLQEKIVMEHTAISRMILPTTQADLTERAENKLDAGQYWADMSADECDTRSTRTFSVVEKGGIADNGDLIGIFNKPWATVGETVEIVARFRNMGTRSVNAKFKGNIKLDGKIVKVIDTDEIIVLPGEVGEFSVFFTPPESGRYSLTGRAVYNNKLTFEKGGILNVEVPPEEGRSRFQAAIPLVLFLAIALIILYLLRKILKERRRRF